MGKQQLPPPSPHCSGPHPCMQMRVGWAWRNSSKDCWMPVRMQFGAGTEMDEE